MDANPTARSENLVIEDLGDGLVVYDSLTQQAHALDVSATVVWRAADGQRTVSEIAEATGLEHATVVASLDQLQARGLFEAGASVSRRAMLRRSATLGAAALAAAPLIETVVIPTAAAHASAVAPMPPPQPLVLGKLTPDNFASVFTVPTGPGLTGAGRYLVRHGSAKVLAPNPFAVFAITSSPTKVTFTNNGANSGGSTPAYHFLLTGKDGLGKLVHATVAGFTGIYVDIPWGSLLNITVSYVPGP